MVIVATVVPYIWHYIHAWLVVHILTCDHDLMRACYLWPTTVLKNILFDYTINEFMLLGF